MPATPCWFGAADRPLFGWFHVPDDRKARAGAVLFPPLGVEYLGTYRAVRLLALGLEQAGIAVLRFDYDGTGDSAGRLDDPGRVDAWRESSTTALAVMRDTGARTIAAIGLRMGATFAAVAAAAGDQLDALVLWDPCRSGRSFVREQQALRKIALGTTTGGPDGASVEVPGFVYDADTVSALAEVDITRTEGPLARRVLAMTRPERPDQQLIERLGTEPVDWMDATQQAQLVDVEPPLAVIPHETIDAIVQWVDDVIPAPRNSVRMPERVEAVVDHDGRGRPIVERATWFGPIGLFGVATEPAAPSAGPTLLFINTSTEPHVGPSRLWVELAREMAAAGLRSVRFDLSGIAESPVRPGQVEDLAYAPEAMEDIAAVATQVSPADPSDVVLVGLCSGAYAAIDAAITIRARSVVAINPILTYVPPDVESGKPDARRQIVRPRRRWLYLLGNAPAFASLKKRLPEWAWAGMARLGIEPSPLTGLERLVEREVDVLLVCDPPAADPLQRRGAKVLRVLEESGHFQLVVLNDLDHGLLRSAPREHAVAIVRDHIRSRYATTVDSAP